MNGISSYFDRIFFSFSISCKATVKRYMFNKASETDTRRHIMKSAYLPEGAAMEVIINTNKPWKCQCLH